MFHVISTENYLELLNDPTNPLLVPIREEAERALARGYGLLVVQKFANASREIQHRVDRLADFRAALQRI